ncbi:hypothetical protein P1I30_026480, partial [Pseudomonas aeruginosa]|nr:hypothetical protein [Pseudomonas aeruginosa]
MATPQPVDARTQPWRETPGGDLVALGRPVRQALHLVRHSPAQGRVLSRRETILLVLFALTLHGAVIHWLSQQRTPALPEVPPQVPPMTIEFTAPAPPVVEPPPPEPLPPTSSSSCRCWGRIEYFTGPNSAEWVPMANSATN